MLHRVETTDPISGRDITDLSDKPFILDRGSEAKLLLYFESEDTKQQFLNISIEHPIEHRLNLDNPTDILMPEG